MALVVRPVRGEDFDDLVSILAAAFANSALYTYISPDRIERQKMLKDIFSFRVRNALDHGITDAALEDGVILGMAAWDAPGGEIDVEKIVSMLRTPLEKYPAAIQERWEQFHRVLFASFAAALRQPFWDIGPVAVRPEAQGKGIASALLRKRFEEIDAAKLPCLLGTQDKRNLDIYSRYGFKTVSSDVVTDGLFTYVMIRPPAR
jgi:ribosomal protein S18 acetylase RimI-like enzyme